MSCPSALVGHPEKKRWIPAEIPAYRDAQNAHAGMTILTLHKNPRCHFDEVSTKV